MISAKIMMAPMPHAEIALVSQNSLVLYLGDLEWLHQVIDNTISEKIFLKPPQQSLDGYKHIVNVQYCPPILSVGPRFPPEAAKAKEAAKNAPNTQNTAEYHDIVEEEMIHGLQRVGWKKVDVSFHSACLPFFAHNNIHVKNEWLHNAGAGVIAHVANTLQQQESRSLIGASL